jgi:hypothetical protein
MADFLGPYSWEQGQSKRWNPTSGEGLVRRWRGSQQMCESYFNSLQGTQGVLDLSMDQDGDGPIYMVTAVFGLIQDGVAETDASIPYFWELAGNMIDKSVFDHPKFYSGQAVDEGASPPIYMTFAQVTDVKQAIQDNLTGAPLSAKIATWTTKQVQLWSEIINGRETYQVSSYALRINRTFSSLYENTVSTANVGKLYTYAQIQAEASTVASPISNAVNANVPASGYWLKQAPVLSELSNRKLQMNQEWWWSDSYSQVLYDLKS